MTDQDKIPRFPDGSPVYPLNSERLPRGRAFQTIAAAFGWLSLLFLALASVYVAFALLSAVAHGDEPLPQDSSLLASPLREGGPIFDQPGECSINANLRVVGTKRASCVEKLSTALRLARAEMLVNEHRRK